MIYFIRDGDDGPVKIGRSRDVARRFVQVRPRPLAELTVIRLLDVHDWVELWFHRHFEALRLTGEWFTFNEEMMTISPPPDRPKGLVTHTGKSRKTKIIALRLPNETMANLKREAHLRAAKPSELIKVAVDEWLQRQVLGKGRAA